ncbi:MAG: FadR/GntR family transcriptional regulator [Asticcacaulis sp.]|uniref:FadR/GntR family transcriptional regulator n=1 Tax=Asticcacaulis sp. TaxID=1872648 RepID=UPI003F7BD065
MIHDTDKRKRLYRRVAEEIIRAIRDGAYKVGGKLPGERDLADSMDASRTTIREAIIALEMLGVVEVRHGSGVYITGEGIKPNTAQAAQDLNVGAFELIEARMVIESETAAIAARVATDKDIEQLTELVRIMEAGPAAAAEQADREFHLLIARITENGALIETVRNLWNLRAASPLAATIISRAHDSGLEARIREHRPILEAIRAHDPAAARRAMREHMECVRDYVLEATEMAEIETLRSQLRSKRDSWASRTAS